jgi:hypothetical protein
MMIKKRGEEMGTLSIDQLILQWKQEKVTPEQVVGYILQHIAQLQEEQKRQNVTLQSMTPKARNNANQSK